MKEKETEKRTEKETAKKRKYKEKRTEKELGVCLQVDQVIDYIEWKSIQWKHNTHPHIITQFINDLQLQKSSRIKEITMSN